MKKYENLDNFKGRIHTVEVTLQEGEYKGTFKQKIGGNCFGKTILDSIDIDEIPVDEQFEENNCQLQIIENDKGEYWYTCVLKDDEGNESNIEEEARYLQNLVVKLEIVDCKIEE
ncbi:DUF5406 family protein [Clostridium tagluense]|uniref:Uncharacterized protein n=1 Tax=Clostridium tagluense TaxID=360422 RepID=A0A401UQD1_9CLOT|nr:DUF5406 family protein [Clostridium tagluense]GCD11737.1 hypothetical protein Ctaglu_33600 [Clostridium tagluense]